MPLTPDSIQTYLDQVYPMAPTAISLATTFMSTAAIVQPILNNLANLKKIVQVSGGAYPTYQGGIARTLAQLQIAYPNSITVGTVVSLLKFNTSTVQSDLARLVLLGLAVTVINPISGAISYAATSGT
jgi:hypothetical protein